VTAKKNLIIVVLATFCLTATLFMIMPTRSSSAERQYDPWIDYNDDGKISIGDIVNTISFFGTSGEPINKTALLYNVNDTFTALLSRIDSLNASLLDLEAYFETRINTLNATLVEQQSRIADLETQLIILNATKLGKPDYDSGWLSIPAGQSRTLPHALNTTNVLVYMIGYDDTGYYVHQLAYGGDATGTGNVYGAWWCKLTETSIEIYRLGQDVRWQQIRVFIWKIPQ